MTHPGLQNALALRHGTEISDPAVTAALAASEEDEATENLAGYISEQGRVLSWRAASGEVVLHESAVTVDDDYAWTPSGTPRVFLFDTEDSEAIRDDTLRLFLTQSLTNGGARRVAGWRDRVVAFVPEEVGAKEATIIRTLADGGIDATHTYNVLDAYSKYSEWVHALADEFGGTDEKLAAGIETPELAPLPYLAASIAQAWLMREAADASLEQARHSLKFGLAGFSRLLNMSDTEPGASVAELARSLHTDRPNLSRAIKSAEGDHRIRDAMTAIDRLAR